MSEPIDTAHLRELMAFATRDKWVVGKYGDAHGVFRLPSGEPDDGGDIICQAWSARDAALIVAAVNALGPMLDELEALRAVKEAAREVSACKGMCGACADKLRDALRKAAK